MEFVKYGEGSDWLANNFVTSQKSSVITQIMLNSEYLRDISISTTNSGVEEFELKRIRAARGRSNIHYLS